MCRYNYIFSNFIKKLRLSKVYILYKLLYDMRYEEIIDSKLCGYMRHMIKKGLRGDCALRDFKPCNHDALDCERCPIYRERVGLESL